MPTKIEWTDETWNPITGCTPVSPACDHCYAASIAHRFWKDRPFGRIYLHSEECCGRPRHWRKPRKIFIGSMTDLFHHEIPDWWRDKVFGVVASCPQHIFQTLTKRADVMRDYFNDPRRREEIARWAVTGGMYRATVGADWEAKIPWPLPNLWGGVTVENQEWADIRIPALLQTLLALRFVSYEPALGMVDVSPYVFPGLFPDHTEIGKFNKPVDWFIAGGESGPKARPSHPDWFRSVRDQCAGAGVPFFFKSWGEWLPDMDCVQRVMYPNRGCWTMEDPPMNFIRRGKEKSEALLDGREYKEFPQ